MPRFHYTATDSTGLPHAGEIDADDERIARDLLQSRGLQIVDLERGEVEVAGLLLEEEQAGSVLMTSEHVEAIGHLGTMLHHGVPLTTALRTLAEESKSPKQRAVLLELGERVAAGEPLEKALTSCHGRLPEWLIALLSAGAASGRLSGCILKYVRFTRLRAQIRTRLIQAILYPAVLLGTGLSVVVFFSLVIVPGMKQIFEGFGTELPMTTRLLIDWSDIFVALAADWFISIPAIIAGTAISVLAARALMGAAGLRRLCYQVPIIGPSLKLVGLTELCELLALFVDHRIPMPKALRLTSSSLRDTNLSDGLNLAAERVEAGLGFRRIMEEVPHLPNELRRVSGWDSDEDVLVQSLRTSSELFAIQGDSYSRTIAAVLPPVAVTCLGLMVGFFVIGLFMPLIKLLNDLS